MTTNQNLLKNLLGLTDQTGNCEPELPAHPPSSGSITVDLQRTALRDILADSDLQHGVETKKEFAADRPKRKRGPAKHAPLHVDLPFDLRVPPANALEVLDRSETICAVLESAKLSGTRLLQVQVAESSGVDEGIISRYVKLGSKKMTFARQYIRENWEKYPPTQLMQRLKRHRTKRGPKGSQSFEAWVIAVGEGKVPRNVGVKNSKAAEQEQLLKLSASNFSFRSKNAILEAELQEKNERLNQAEATEGSAAKIYHENRALVKTIAALQARGSIQMVELKGVQTKPLTNDEIYITKVLEDYLHVKVEMDPSAYFIALHCRSDYVLQDLNERMLRIHSELSAQTLIPANVKALIIYGMDGKDFKRILGLLLEKCLARKL